MPQTFLIFDFGTNEDAAQQARHRLDAWKQAFRLGDKLKFKFERQATEPPAEAAPEPPAEPEKKKKSTKAKTAKGKAKGKTKTKAKEEPAAEPVAAKPAPTDRLRLLVRLEFSDHEKLTFQRWLDRIPAEAPFPTAGKQMVRRGQEGFDETATLFNELP